MRCSRCEEWQRICENLESQITGLREDTADRIEALEAALRLRDALIEAADDLYAAYAGFARTDGQHEAMSNFSTASNTYRAALASEQEK